MDPRISAAEEADFLQVARVLRSWARMAALKAVQSYRSAAAAIGIRFHEDQSNSNQSDRTISAVGAQQVCTRLASVPWAIAFFATEAPSTSHSAWIRVFGSGLESRGVHFLTVAIVSMI